MDENKGETNGEKINHEIQSQTQLCAEANKDKLQVYKFGTERWFIPTYRMTQITWKHCKRPRVQSPASPPVQEMYAKFHNIKKNFKNPNPQFSNLQAAMEKCKQKIKVTQIDYYFIQVGIHLMLHSNPYILTISIIKRNGLLNVLQETYVFCMWKSYRGPFLKLGTIKKENYINLIKHEETIFYKMYEDRTGNVTKVSFSFARFG